MSSSQNTLITEINIQKPNFNRFILNNHQKRNNADKEKLGAIAKTEPTKTVACQRCRRLRKKCSKHFPNCLTCVKIGENCEYVDKINLRRKRKLNDEITPESNQEKSLPNINSFVPNKIRLPSISINQEEESVEKKPNNTSIQNAIISTLINLGKQSFHNTNNSKKISLTKELALKYSKSYFDNFYHLYPFIHKGEFYKEFNDLNLSDLLNPFSITDDTKLKTYFQFYLILNIGFKNLHNSNNLNQVEIDQYSEIFSDKKTQDFIFNSLTLNSVEDVKILTLLVIDSFFTRNCLTTTNLANLLTGLALRLNLHRKLSKERSDSFTMFEIEMRYRLFWSIYIIDRTVAVYLNKLIAIPDEYINLPYPIFWREFDSEGNNLNSDLTVGYFNDFNFQLLIELKQIEGSIFKEVHSVLAINNRSPQENEVILKGLRYRIESWYLKTTNSSSKISLNNNFDNGCSSIWYATRYYNCLTLLYRHSYLNPILNDDFLDKLSKAVLQNLSYSYNSSINKASFSMNWMSFFRILIILKTLLKCLASGNINVYESKTELNLCIELLKNYVNQNKDWLFIYDIIKIFKDLLKMSYAENSDEEEILEKLQRSEINLSKVLKKNTVGCRLDDKIEDEYNLEERIGDEYNLAKGFNV